MDNDTELLRQYVERRDEPAFADFVARNLPLVYSAALRRLDGDAAGASDVAQAVFTQISQRASTLVQHPCLAGWLYSATRRAAANFARGERRRKLRENAAVHMDIDTRETLTPSWEKIRPLIDGAMDELKSNDREAVLMRFFGQHSFAEIGAKLAVSENAARMRVDRALEKLRERLGKRGIVSTTAALTLALGNEAIATTPAHLAATISASALASSMVGSTSVFVTALTLMKHTKLVATVTAIFAGVGFGIHASLEAKAAKAELAVANQQAATAREETDRLQKQLANSAPALADLRTQIAALQNKPSAAPPLSSGPVTKNSANLYSFSNPSYSRAYMDEYQKSLPVKYAALFHALNLTPEQVSQFENAMMECRQNVVEIWAAAEQQNLLREQNTPASTAVARMTSDPMTARNDALKGILGVSGFNQFESFDAPQAIAARDVFSAVSATFYSVDDPLTSTQGDQLSRIINANTEQIKTPMASDGGKQMYSLSAQTNWDKVLASASATLSSAQLTTLQAAIEQQRGAESLRNFNPAISAVSGPSSAH
jgi:RNA polymerase sigma factor (sigma-70 family)